MNLDGGTITTILAVLIPAGSALASYAVLRERVNRHDRSLENFGERLGAMEKAQAHQAGELSRPITIRDPAAPR
jgi:hypothetical protein